MGETPCKANVVSAKICYPPSEILQNFYFLADIWVWLLFLMFVIFQMWKNDFFSFVLQLIFWFRDKEESKVQS